MPRLIERPTIIQGAGNKPKRIEEYAGRINSGHAAVSVARMVSPGGWEEPGQRPECRAEVVVECPHALLEAAGVGSGIHHRIRSGRDVAAAQQDVAVRGTPSPRQLVSVARSCRLGERPSVRGVHLAGHRGERENAGRRR